MKAESVYQSIDKRRVSSAILPYSIGVNTGRMVEKRMMHLNGFRTYLKQRKNVLCIGTESSMELCSTTISIEIDERGNFQTIQDLVY